MSSTRRTLGVAAGLLTLAVAEVGLDLRAALIVLVLGLALLAAATALPYAAATTGFAALMVVAPGVRYLLSTGNARPWLLLASATVLSVYLLLWSDVALPTVAPVAVAGLAASVLMVVVAAGVAVHGPIALIVGLVASAVAYRVCVPSSRRSG